MIKGSTVSFSFTEIIYSLYTNVKQLSTNLLSADFRREIFNKAYSNFIHYLTFCVSKMFLLQ